MKRFCRKRLAEQKTNQGGRQQKAHIAEHTEENESAFYVFMTKDPTDNHRSFAWCINLGASLHFSNRQDGFTEYTTSSYKDSVLYSKKVMIF